ncbi:hypothetical protein CR513_08857, partial [Mucuna pruriens]
MSLNLNQFICCLSFMFLQSKGSGLIPSQIILSSQANVSVITLRSGKELAQQQTVNLHSKFPDFDDFTDCDCTCTVLIEFLICTKISSVINVDVGVVDIVGGNVTRVVIVQPPLTSIMQPLQPLVITTNKLQLEQKERLLQDFKKLEDFYEHLVKNSTLRLLLKKPPKDVALELLRWIRIRLPQEKERKHEFILPNVRLKLSHSALYRKRR